MSQSNGYKRFRSSIDTFNHGTSTPQAPKTKIFPRASTPNRFSLEPFDQSTLPVPAPTRPKPVVQQKISRKRRQHRSKQQLQIYVDHIILIQQEKQTCSHCHRKKSNSKRILGVL